VPEYAFQAKYAKNSNSYMFRSVYQIDMKFDRKLRPAKETSWVDRKYFLFTGPSEDLCRRKMRSSGCHSSFCNVLCASSLLGLFIFHYVTVCAWHAEWKGYLTWLTWLDLLYGLTCNDVDIDECATDNGGCSAHATCTNIPDSFTCTCLPAYIGDGFTCIPRKSDWNSEALTY